MTYFLHQPAGIFLRSNEELISVGKELEIATYVVCATPTGEFFLKKVDDFTRPLKLYGTVGKKADRILTTFKDRPNSTGVLLSGEQGSGKTMLARELSLLGAARGLATIIVNTPFAGASFNMFMQMINVPAVVIIDEFEKMYDDEGQEKMLTLLDGLFPSKKLFVLTCNNTWRLDQHLLNRPGRIFYHLKYEGLEAAFILEYCQDVLKNKNEIAAVERITKHFFTFNFDMLVALIEEMNRFDITAIEAVEMLNMTPVSGDDQEHAVTVVIDGKDVSSGFEKTHDCNPLDGENIIMSFFGDEGNIPKRFRRDDRTNRTRFEFNLSHITKIDGGTFVFENDGVVLTLTRSHEKQFKYNMKAH